MKRHTTMDTTLRKAVTYIGERPSEFCVVTPFANLAQYAEEAARHMDLRTCVALSGFDNDVEVALELLHTEQVKLLATRGHALQILRNKTTVPVLSISYSSENFMETLLPYQNSGMSVGHICFPGQGLNFMKIAHILGLEGHRLEVENRDNIDAALQSARDKKISLLVGGFGLVSKAREEGFQAIPLLSENREAVYQVFTEAKHLLAMDAVNAHRQMFMNTVLNINPNIIIVVDDQQVIKYANDSALKVFDPLSPDCIGLPLNTLFPDVDFNAILHGEAGKNEPGVLTDSLRRDFLFNAVKISLHHSFSGHILSLSNVVEIQKNERKVRQNVYDKSNRPLFCFDDIIGGSQSMTQSRQMAIRFARSDDPVLLVGDTGTGKEMFAQAIHVQSKRRPAPFVTVNCASLPENLLESELFGYEEGAFTGARRGGKTGLFELAHGGTLFLDEIGEMPLQLQSRLLRVLHDKIVMRVGSTRFIPVDVRIVCATNRDILNMVEAGSFRSDLFYRINTLILRIPALEERKEDIDIIVRNYLKKYMQRKKEPLHISKEALEKLKGNTWRGNVRELLHIVDRAVVLCTGNTITPEAIILDEAILQGQRVPGVNPVHGKTAQVAPLAEGALIRDALAAHQYHKSRAARALGMSRATLWRKMRQLALG